MLFDLDAFKPQSAIFRFLSRGFDIRRLPQDYAWEIAVLFNPPGIFPRHICLWMGSTERFLEFHLQKLVISSVDDEGVQAAARANEASITLEDGPGVLRGLIAAQRRWKGMPVAATMWLKVMSHEQGLSAREIGDQLRVSTARVGRWLHGNGF